MEKKRAPNVVDWYSNKRIQRIIIEAVKLHRQAKKEGAKGGSRLHWNKTELELFQKYGILIPHECLKNHSKIINKWLDDKELNEMRRFLFLLSFS